MNRIPFLDLKAQYLALRSEILPALEQVCESVRYAQGPPTAEFEQGFAAYCDAKHCVSLNTGTSALHLALACLNVGPGDEVVTVPMTFVATTWAISYVGAKPVFVDIDPVTRTMDATQLEKAITPRTKAIIPVHLYGMPCDMDAILAIADRHGIPVIEDACQAHGARHRGRRVGTLGQMSAFSFYPGKNLGAYGEGGALVTNNDAFAARSRRLRDHAQGQRYYHEELGFNYRMDSLQGAILNIKLKHLEAWNNARRACATRYQQQLQGLPITIPQTPAYAESVWHLFVIELDQRDQLRTALGELGIETGLHYPVPVHLQKAYQHLGHKVGDFPVSERLAQRCLSLPVFAELTMEQVDAVAAGVRKVLTGR